MTFDHELILISKTEGENELGDPVTAMTRKPVLCELESVTRSEHYQAASAGLKPSMVFVINKWDYEGEQDVEFEDKLYKVMRTYQRKKAQGLADFEALELICEGVINRGNA